MNLVKNRNSILIFVFSILGFAVLFVAGGGARVDLGDSQGYIQFNRVAPPLYPTFLWIMRLLLGEMRYLQVVALLQNLLAAFSVWYLTITVKKHFHLNELLSFMVLFLAYVPHVFTPLLSRTHFVLTNAILSEGISVSLYYFWLAVLIEAVVGKSCSKYYTALLISLLLIMTRKQLLFVCIVTVLLCFYLLNDYNWKQFLYRVCALVISVVIYVGCNYLYLHILANPVVNLTYDSGRTSSVMYNADESDRDLFDDAKTKELFDILYQGLDRQKFSYRYGGNGLLEAAQYQENCYDTGAGLILKETFDYFEKQGIKNTDEQIIIARKNLSQIRKKLYINNWQRQVKYSFRYVVQGLIRTVATTNKWLCIYAALLYILAITLIVYLLSKGKNSKSAVWMIWVLVIILGNVCSTALVIMCLSRYMIYNMSIFYISGLMMLKESFELEMEKKR